MVVGDLVLDRMLVGRASRLSREAPIPVLDEVRCDELAGGGTAPALTVAGLGGDVRQIGVVGDDDDGWLLRRLVAARGVGVEAIVTDPARPTTVKTRVVAEGFHVFPQQVARIDRAAQAPISPEAETAMIAALDRSVEAGIDAILLSDYGGGVCSPALIARVRAARGQTLLAVDAQSAPDRFTGFDLVRCNEAEAERALGEPISADAVAAGRARIGCRWFVVTRGGDRALLADERGVIEAPAENRTEVYDVTGAGDAVTAVLTVALATGAEPEEALTLAQIAGGIAVRRWGNLPVDVADLRAAIDERARRERD